MYILFCPESQRRQLYTRHTPVPLPLIAYHHMADNLPHKRSRQTTLRKNSRRKRDAQVDAGELDPELDFVCPHCHGIYSLYYGRHKLHLRACKRRVAQTIKTPQEQRLPTPPPFECEVFPAPATTGE